MTNDGQGYQVLPFPASRKLVVDPAELCRITRRSSWLCDHHTGMTEMNGVMAAGRWYSAEQLAKMIEIPGSKK